MAVPFLLVIFLGGALADVMETDPSQCDVESPSFLQLKHKGQQAEQDTLQLLVTSTEFQTPGQPGVVYKCNVMQNPDFSQDCVDLTTGRIPAGVQFSLVWEVEALPEPENGFLVLSLPVNGDDGSVVYCPEVGDCSALLPPGRYEGLALDGQGNFCFTERATTVEAEVKCCLLSNSSECTVLNTFVSQQTFNVVSLTFSPEGDPIIGLTTDSIWRCKMTGTCTLSTDQCQENPPTCERLGPSLEGYDDATFGSGNYYLSADFSGVFKQVLKCVADEPSPCNLTKEVIGENAEVTPDPGQLGRRVGALLVENESSLLVVDTFADRVLRCDVSISPAQCKVIVQDPDPNAPNFVHDVAFVNAATATTTKATTEAATTQASTTEVSTTKAATTQASTTEVATTKAATTEASTTEAATTTITTTRLSFAVFEKGVYCYDAGAADGTSSTSYRSFKEMESRDECEDLCAADVHCNYYSWYSTTERCDRCVFYSTCKYQNKSVCFDESNRAPRIYKKSSENTTRPVTQSSAKKFVVRADRTGKYCQGREILSIPVATQDECQGNCSVVSSCQFVAYYFLEDDNAGPLEDATPTACNVQCRLFSGCTRTVKSLCYPPATIWEASSPAP